MDHARAVKRRHDGCGGLARAAAAAVTVLAVLVAGTASATATPPATPSPLPTAVEAYQPYVGQAVCDPVAKPGVRAFSSLVLDAYPGTTSLGIVRDCGVGAASEHKEGRAWDWGVSAYNPRHVAEVQELLTWLLATDRTGKSHANLRRLGIMYVIWNKKIFKAYQPSLGWQTYTGPSPHTDHVHFSFGWAGAKKLTSFWDGTVAEVDHGPGGAPATPLRPVVSPVPDVAHLQVLARYGTTTLRKGSTGEAVETIQRPLGLTVDGDFGSATAAAVAAFQQSQGLEPDGVFGPASWHALFPRPTVPYGQLETVRSSLGQVTVRGWALDAETTDPLRVHVHVDGAWAAAETADLRRSDVAQDNPGTGSAHGFDLRLTLSEGVHRVCAYALNAPGTAGRNALLGCSPVTVSHTPTGALESVVQGPTGVVATGWAIDPDVATPVAVDLHLDGRLLTSLPRAAAARPELAATHPEHGTAHGFSVPLAVPDGTHSVCAVARNAAGTPGADRRLGCRSVVVRHSPVGSLDADVPTPGKVVVSGWTLDHDTAAPVVAHVYVDGRFVRQVTADLPREDLPAALGAYGRRHGFRTELQLAEGTHTVCAYGLNAAGTVGSNSRVGCHTVTVRHTPVGALETVASGLGGVHVVGWAIDPDVAGPVTAQVLVDGRLVRDVPATTVRADVAARHRAYGPAHGVRTSLELSEGRHSVCLRALNVAGTPGTTGVLGCKDVLVRHTPVGVLEQVAPGPDGVVVSGWALDPDTAASVRTHLYVDGRKVAEPRADLPRADIGARYPGYGPAHGFRSEPLPLTAGTHSVCLWALNAAGTGGNVRLGCRSVVVENTAKGALEAVTAVPGGAAVTGWALDPDTTATTRVHVYADGAMRADLPADRPHAGVSRTLPAYGSAHGFAGRLALAKGVHTVCAWALNAPGTVGGNRYLGCKRVTVA